MSLLAAIRKLWHSIAPRTHSDVEEEFRSTLDAYQEDLIRQGLTEEEARRKARIDLGQPATGCKAPLPQAVCSQPPPSLPSAHSSPACCPPTAPSPFHPPKLSALSKAWSQYTRARVPCA